MIVYRLSKEKYKDDLSGYGASIYGQRWNSKGVEMIYTAQSRALSTCEVVVHLPLGIIPTLYYVVEIEIPDLEEIYEIEKLLSLDWINDKTETQKIGDDFIHKNKYLVMKVPSAIISHEYNYIINPHHKNFGRIKIIKTEKFPIDKRFIFK